MKRTLDYGVFTLAFRDNRLRFQFYWPYIRLRFPGVRHHREVMAYADTCFRVVSEDGYVGAGFNILGLGLGFDYFLKKEFAQTAQCAKVPVR